MRVEETVGDALEVISAACPGSSIQARELDAVKVVNGKVALAAAIREAARDRDGIPKVSLRERMRTKPDSPGSAREVATVLRREYGPDFFLARSADRIATITDAAEKRAQAPIDRINKVADAIAETGGRAFGLKSEAVPDLKIKSKVSTRRAGVSLSTRW